MPGPTVRIAGHQVPVMYLGLAAVAVGLFMVMRARSRHGNVVGVGSQPAVQPTGSAPGYSDQSGAISSLDAAFQNTANSFQEQLGQLAQAVATGAAPPPAAAVGNLQAEIDRLGSIVNHQADYLAWDFKDKPAGWKPIAPVFTSTPTPGTNPPPALPVTPSPVHSTPPPLGHSVPPTPAPVPHPVPPAPRSYTVQPGDSLSAIAKKVYGNAGAWTTLYAANAGAVGGNPNVIHPGTRLSLP